MRNNLVILLLLFFLMILSQKSFAQCSDAGVCQVGNHYIEKGEMNLLDISFSYKFGSSGKDDDVQFHSVQLNSSYNFLDNSSVQLIIPYNIQSGPAGKVNGIGDLILSLNQKLISEENSLLGASISVKLAIGNDDKNKLPQVYQNGSGSNDLIFALSYSYSSVSVSAGYQLAGGRNNNIFKLKRGDDLLLRGSYSLNFGEISVTPQLLFIKRLSRSSIVDFNSLTEKFIEVNKSNQTQLNLLTVMEYDFDGIYSLIGEFAIPFIKREVNVDGLTRVFSASIGVKFSID